MCVNPGDASWAFMSARQRRPRPRTRLSSSSSGTIDRMFPTFTLFTRPLMPLRSASQDSRWNSADRLSLSAISCRSAASLNGGT